MPIHQHEKSKKRPSLGDTGFNMNENEFIEMAEKLSKNLGVVSQYIMLLVPFICKFVIKTVEEIRKNNKSTACEKAMKSGFWEEEMENFKYCLGKKSRKSKRNELNNNANCEQFKVHSIYSEDDETQAIERIMNAIDHKKINIKYLRNEESLSKLIDKWATKISKIRKENEKRKFHNSIVRNPMKYFLNNYDLRKSTQNKNVEKTYLLLQEILFNSLKSNGLYEYFTSFYSHVTDKTMVLKAFLKDLSINNRKSPMYPIEFSDQINLIDKIQYSDYFDRYKENNKEISDSSSFKEKYDLSPCLDRVCRKIEISQFPKLTFENSKGEVIQIPDWEIQNIFDKYYYLPKLQEVEKAKIFKSKEFDEFGNLERQLDKKRAQTRKKEELKKSKIRSRIKIKE